MHRLETCLLVSGWIITPASILLIPRKKALEASFICIQAQLFTWILGLVVVEFGWLEYPVHALSNANSTSFLFEYMLFPLLAAQFILRYPTAKVLRLRILYFAVFISVITVTEVLVEKYTLIIQYNSWKWYWTFISMSLVFYFTMVLYKWFFKIPRVFSI